MKLGYIYGSKIVGDMSLGTDPYTGNPSNLTVPGDLTVLGDFTFGNAAVDTLIVNGRTATGSIDGAAIDIDDTYTYDAFSEIRADVSDWTNIPGAEPKNFYGRYARFSTSIASANWLYGEQVYAANGLPGAAGVDVAMIESFIFNTMGKGGSTIDLMRGGEIKCEWATDDTVTDAVGLQIEFMGLAAPTNTIFGLKFEKESAAGAMVAKFHEIQMKEGLHIISGTASPNGVITAPAGSLCLVSTGNSVATCAFINTDGGTTWAAFT